MVAFLRNLVAKEDDGISDNGLVLFGRWDYVIHR